MTLGQLDYLKNPVLNSNSFKMIVIQSRKLTLLAGLRCTRQKLLFHLSLLSSEPDCDFTTIKESRLNDKKIQQNVKGYKTIRPPTVLKLAPPQNRPQSSLFSEDIYTLVKSCSCFFEIS